MVASLGMLMIIYVVIGGMRAATVIQLVKAVILLGGGAILALLVMSKFSWNPAGLLNRAAGSSGLGDAFLQPGVRYGDDRVSKLDSLSLQLAVLLGAAGLPHLLMRLGAVPTARAARGSVQWATYLTLAFCLLAGVMGFGAVALLGRGTITADSASGNSATLLLAEFLGGAFLVTLVSCVAFTTVLAVVAGLVLAASTALAHDLYQVGFRNGEASEKSELLVAKGSVLLIGLVGTVLSMYAQGLNISFMVGLAFAVAGSAILPALLYSMYWKGFTTRGALWSIYGGSSRRWGWCCFPPPCREVRPRCCRRRTSRSSPQQSRSGLDPSRLPARLAGVAPRPEGGGRGGVHRGRGPHPRGSRRRPGIRAGCRSAARPAGCGTPMGLPLRGA